MIANGRAAWPVAVRLLLASEGAATALWLVPASVAIVQWPASGPDRLALLLPAWQLAAWWLVGAAAAGLVWWRASEPASTDAWPSRMAPLSLLWLWAVPYLPWIPDRWPLLLVLDGPIRWLVLAVALLMTVRAPLMRMIAGWSLHVGRRAVFALSLAVYAGLGLYSAATVGLGGDEPHYLIITESLIRDRDLKIENNHRQRDYQSFFQGELRPDFFERGTNGEIYSVHAPGLPALAIPVYLLGGYRGVVALIALIAALTALAVFDLAEGLVGRRAALMAWLATCFTVPFVPYAWAIFPEMPGALLVAWAALWLWQPGERGARLWFVRGVLLAALPWLHTKFIVFLAMFAAGFAIRLLRQPAKLFALGAPIAVSTVAWFYSFFVIYGSFNPESPYGDYSRVNVLNKYVLHGLIGILFDQKFGLLFYSPIYVAAVIGAWYLLKRRDARLLGAVLLLAAGAFVGSTARLYMFWGGSSAPARFLVPVLPCLAPMLALALHHAERVVAKSLLGAWLVIGLLIAAFGVVLPDGLRLFSDPHGRARLLEWLQAGSPLSLVVPTFTEPTWANELGGLALWCGVAVAAYVALALAVRSQRVDPWTGALITGGVFLAGGAMISAHPAESVRIATARRGAIQTLTRFDGDRFRTFAYDSMGRVTADQLLTRTVFPWPLLERVQGSVAVSQPLVIPPGRYDVEISFTDSSPRSAEIAVADSPRAVFGRVTGALSNPVHVPFETPMATRRLTVNVPETGVAKAISRISLRARAVVPPSRRETRPVRAIESIAGTPRGYIGYVDEHAYPEGGVFWTRGTTETHVIVATGGATRMQLILSTGPRRGTVTVTLDGAVHTVEMSGGQENTISLPLNPIDRLVTLGVQSSVMFRPADEDSASTDTRGLGCQVRLILD